jgi:hypothetical protein
MEERPKHRLTTVHIVGMIRIESDIHHEEMIACCHLTLHSNEKYRSISVYAQDAHALLQCYTDT